jgi:hypothetical protein
VIILKKLYITLSLGLTLLQVQTSIAQSRHILDTQLLSGGFFRQLVSVTPKDSQNRYYLESFSYHSADTQRYLVPDYGDIPGGSRGAVFFIDQQNGFITEHGGCYAYYNRLNKTSDGGKTWRRVLYLVGVTYPANLSDKNFYMFDRLSGVIVWSVAQGKLLCSFTHNGGETWQPKEISFPIDNPLSVIRSISFSDDGHIQISMGTSLSYKKQVHNQLVFESIDYGKSYRRLK